MKYYYFQYLNSEISSQIKIRRPKRAEGRDAEPEGRAGRGPSRGCGQPQPRPGRPAAAGAGPAASCFSCPTAAACQEPDSSPCCRCPVPRSPPERGGSELRPNRRKRPRWGCRRETGFCNTRGAGSALRRGGRGSLAVRRGPATGDGAQGSGKDQAPRSTARGRPAAHLGMSSLMLISQRFFLASVS